MTPDLKKVISTLLAKTPEIFANKVVSEVERVLGKPVEFRREDIKRAGKLVPSFRRAHASSDWVPLYGPPGRGAFLAATRRFLASQPEEWAVVGLGTVAGRSFVKEVFVRRGQVGRVGLPDSVQAQIRGHIEATPNAEVFHVHNHPGGILRELKNLTLGDAPITSDGDRDAQQAYEAVAVEAASRTKARRSVRFLVVENRQLHEYRLPSKGPLREASDRFIRSLLGMR
jgi:hypothetical protein